MYLGKPYPIIQHFYFTDMIGIAPLPRDDDKALLSPEEQRKVDLKVNFKQRHLLSLQAHVPLKPSQRDANVIFYPLLY